jgi:putative ABC transport system ATP-binding protein
MPLIQIRNLSKAYQRGGQRIAVLSALSLDVEEGEFVGLMGPSGSGKSTLLNLIAGIDKPDAGTLLVAGVDITQLSETDLAHWRGTHVGFIFQFYNLMPVLTAVENVELPLMLTHLSRRERRERAEFTLELVGLADRMTHQPSELSGGQQQRVAVARSLVNNPAIILADEPTGNLDTRSSVEVMQIFQRLNTEQGITVIFVTHESDIAEHTRRVIRVRDGVIARDEPVEHQRIANPDDYPTQDQLEAEDEARRAAASANLVTTGVSE